MAEEKKTPMKKSDKANSKESKESRAAQSKAGNVFLNQTKEFTVKGNYKHLKKGDKVKLNRATEELFRAKGFID